MWKVKALVNGFEVMVMVKATCRDDKLIEYLNTELPGWVSYSGATRKEEEAAVALGMKVYMV